MCIRDSGKNVHPAGHQLVHFLHGDGDVHGRAGVVLFDDADDRQIHHLLDLGDVPHGVGADAHSLSLIHIFHESMDALSVIYALLKSHEVIDLLIIMLGTNDVKERFGANAACIAAGMERLILKAKSVDCWGTKQPNILVVAPPPIGAGFHDAVMGDGCVEKSAGVAGQLRIICERQGVHFLDAKDCEFNQVDFMHLTRKGHAQLAELLAKEVPGLI